jgi:hypothetical protein
MDRVELEVDRKEEMDQKHAGRKQQCLYERRCCGRSLAEAGTETRLCELVGREALAGGQKHRPYTCISRTGGETKRRSEWCQRLMLKMFGKSKTGVGQDGKARLGPVWKLLRSAFGDGSVNFARDMEAGLAGTRKPEEACEGAMRRRV